jgi:hypothetical protein
VIHSVLKCNPAVDEEQFYKFVESAVCSDGQTGDRLLSIDRRYYEYYSSFAMEEVRAIRHDGSCVELIFKNLGRTGELDHARQIRPPFNYDPLREIAVYRNVLADAQLGTARCYGTFADQHRDTYWLLLEKINGAALAKVGDFEVWRQAARWLANMHLRLRPVASSTALSMQLLRYDASYCNIWIDRAVTFCDKRQFTSEPIISSSEMRALARSCRSAIQHLCSLPFTFLHGDYYASNILVQQHERGLRVCPVDWETAAIGPGVVDLAALVAGDWSEPAKDELAALYYETLSVAGRPWNNCREMLYSLRCCRLFLALRWLGWSVHWQPPAEHRFDWLTEAICLAESVESDRC